MNKLHGIKVAAAGVIVLLSFSAIAVNKAFAQEKPKPAPQAEPMSGCGCCKKMMSDTTNKMPAGMNHPMPTGK